MKRGVVGWIVFMTLGWGMEQPITPLPAAAKTTQKSALGALLFFDVRLSSDGTVSCASCHRPSQGWADGRRVSVGVKGRKGRVNSPTVLNAVFNFRQFWNGRAKDLKEQADGPIRQHFEMDMRPDTLVKRLGADSEYRRRFRRVYGTRRITYEQVLDALAAFEATLTTPDSLFDRFLRAEATLDKKQLEGYRLFKTLGCITCHNGRNVGGNSFQKIGIVRAYENCYDDRYEITRRPFDRCMYKVPSLRNVALTAPYFHDGSAATLKEAIRRMSLYNLGVILSDEETEALESFLKTLTGKMPSFDLKEDGS